MLERQTALSHVLAISEWSVYARTRLIAVGLGLGIESLRRVGF